MNIKEAYNLMGVNENISDEELKKAYRKLAAKYHPDIYKEDPNKFSEINQAYQYIQDYKSGKFNQNQQGRNPFEGGFASINIEDLFNFSGSQPRQNIQGQPIHLNMRISFQESVLGCDKQISFKRKIKCDTCNGQGVKIQGNGCTDCDGFGRVTRTMNGMIFQSNCNKCSGRNVTKEKCNSCNGSCTKEVDFNNIVRIPSAISNGKTLTIRNAGNYVGNSFFGDSYSDVLLTVFVEPDAQLTFDGKYVCSNVTISLLDAFRGVDKEVKTLFSTQKIKISPRVKNGTDIFYVCSNGSKNIEHKTTVYVDYPNDLNKIIKFLEENE